MENPTKPWCRSNAPAVLCDHPLLLGEGVVWDEERGGWWWVDILGHTLYFALSTGDTLGKSDGAKHQGIAVPVRYFLSEPVCFVALTQQKDKLLLGLASGLAIFSVKTQRVSRLCSVQADIVATRLNDGRCDRHGNVVFGTMNQHGPDALGQYFRYTASRQLQPMDLPPVAIANSTCFSPDGHQLYYCDTPQKKIMVCDYDSLTGQVCHQRVFTDLAGEDGAPDGSCIDSEGHLWNARWGGGKVVRYRPDGRIDFELALPVSQPSCVALGGPFGDQLCITTARQGLTHSKDMQDGHVFIVELNRRLALAEGRWAGLPFTDEAFELMAGKLATAHVRAAP